MRLFIDSANLSDIREAFASGIASGCTTNPAILAKEPPHPGGYVGHLRDILRSCPGASDNPLSVQPPVELLREAPKETVGALKGHLLSRNLVIKIPVSWDNLPVIRALAPVIPINATCVFTAEQAIAAINAGARYISLFWGRINDASKSQANESQSQEERNVCKPGGAEAELTARRVRDLIDSGKLPCQIIAGSIRTPKDALEAFVAGCHIVTTGLPVLKAMANSDLSDASSAGFEEKRIEWNNACEVAASKEGLGGAGPGEEGGETSEPHAA